MNVTQQEVVLLGVEGRKVWGNYQGKRGRRKLGLSPRTSAQHWHLQRF